MSFARTLRKTCRKAKASAYELAGESRIDYKHVRRLLSGEADNPHRSTIIRLGQALLDLSGSLTLDDVDSLLAAAKMAPLRRERIVLPKR